MKAIPELKDWEDLTDLDIQWAHETFGGQDIHEAIDTIERNPIIHLGHFHWMPAKPFQYYLSAYIGYVESFGWVLGDFNHATYTFLNTLLQRIKADKSVFEPVYGDVQHFLLQILERPEDFGDVRNQEGFQGYVREIISIMEGDGVLQTRMTHCCDTLKKGLDYAPSRVTITYQEPSWMLTAAWYATEQDVRAGEAEEVGEEMSSTSLAISYCPYCGGNLREMATRP